MDATTVYNKSQSSVKLLKMSKGYNWEIKVYGDDMEKIDEELKKQDGRLKEAYSE